MCGPATLLCAALSETGTGQRPAGRKTRDGPGALQGRGGVFLSNQSAHFEAGKDSPLRVPRADGPRGSPEAREAGGDRGRVGERDPQDNQAMSHLGPFRVEEAGDSGRGVGPQRSPELGRPDSTCRRRV